MALEYRFLPGKEITFLELWQIFYKWRLLGASVFTFILISALAYLWIAPPVFESEASFYIGEMDGVPLEAPVPVVERMEARYGKNQAQASHSDRWLSKVAQDRHDERMILITSRAPSGEEARDLAQQALDEIVSAHTMRFNQRIQRTEGELKVMDDLLKKGLESLDEAKKTHFTSEQNLNVIGALYTTVELANLQERIGKLRETLEGMKTSNTAVVQYPTGPAEPASPKVGLVMLASVVLGLFFFVVTAFFAEYLSTFRKAKLASA